MERLSDSPRVSPLLLGWVFLCIGALAFGGLGAALALVERELVTTRRMLTAAEVTAALTYTKLLPGSTVVQVMSYLGYTLGGWPGSALATAAFVLPAALVMLLLAVAYVAATVLPAFGPAVNGLTAAVVGMLLATTYRLGKANITTPLMGRIALGSAHLWVRQPWPALGQALVRVRLVLVGWSWLPTGQPTTPSSRSRDR